MPDFPALADLEQQACPTNPTNRPTTRSPLHVYLARLSTGSRPAMGEALEAIARLASGGRIGGERFPWHMLRYEHVQAIRAKLTEVISERTGKPLSAATINKSLCALRGVLREAWRLDLMTAEEFARAIDVSAVRGSTPLRGRALSPHEVAALFQACMGDSSPAGPRDAVILALGFGAGLRRAEMTGLDLCDVSLDQEVVRVAGKGNKIREVPIKGGTIEALRAWYEHRGTEPGPLLCSVRKGGRLYSTRLAPQAILRVCDKRARQAGVSVFSPHDMRRSYVSALLDCGVDLATASDLAGHSSAKTTQRYDRRGERARHAAAAQIAVPFVRRR
jgi:integrase/recombinase XerD